jgi:hypothetical protein
MIQIDELFVGAIVRYESEIGRVIAINQSGSLPLRCSFDSCTILIGELQFVVAACDLRPCFIGHDSIMAMGAKLVCNGTEGLTYDIEGAKVVHNFSGVFFPQIRTMFRGKAIHELQRFIKANELDLKPKPNLLEVLFKRIVRG